MKMEKSLSKRAANLGAEYGPPPNLEQNDCVWSGGEYKNNTCVCGKDYFLEDGQCMGQDGLTKKDIEQIKRNQAELFRASGDTDAGLLVVEDGKVLMKKELDTRIGKITFSLNCYGQTSSDTALGRDSDSTAGLECIGEQALFAVFPNGASEMVDSMTAVQVEKMNLLGDVRVSMTDSNVVLIQYAPEPWFWNTDLKAPASPTHGYSLNLMTRAVSKIR